MIMVEREFEELIHTDFEAKLDYQGYLCLDKLLGAQKPLSVPEHHDEMLFIIQHQTSELWMKLAVHELKAAVAFVKQDQLSPCFKILSRVKQIQRMLFEQWAAIPASCVVRDWSLPYVENLDLIPVFKTIYDDPSQHWDAYEMCEKLVDVEESFSLWRFRHVKTVERIIGFKKGTGGSSGVPFLQKALSIRLFPELWDVRTEIGQ